MLVLLPNPILDSPSHHAVELPADDLLDLPAGPPIGRDKLLKQCMGNLAFAISLLDGFKNTSSERLEAFDYALAKRDRDAIVCLAHGFKGVASALAFNNLIEICSNLESEELHSDWIRTYDLIWQLRRGVRRVIDYLPSIRASS